MSLTGENCVHPIDGTVDPLTFQSLSAANLAAMGIVDWAALLFATCIAALAVVGELKVRYVCLLLSQGSFSLDYIVSSVRATVTDQACTLRPRILCCAPSQLRKLETS